MTRFDHVRTIGRVSRSDKASESHNERFELSGVIDGLLQAFYHRSQGPSTRIAPV
jgi:hypothetical protein